MLLVQQSDLTGFLIISSTLLICVIIGAVASSNSNRDKQERSKIKAHLTGHRMILPQMECPKCMMIGRKGMLRLHNAFCVDPICNQKYVVIWNGQYGMLVPKEEANQSFEDYSKEQLKLFKELVSKSEGGKNERSC